MSTLPTRILAFSSLGTLALAGCATGNFNGASSAAPLIARAIAGSVHGGQQPIVGSVLSLYAAGKIAIGSPARSMLTAPVMTDSNGTFSITGLYTCQPGDQVFLVGRGGNAGAGSNPSIALMAALGPCDVLKANAATTFINVDEVTTVASVFALSRFMTSIQNLGADGPNQNALAAAFATTQTMVNLSTGQAPATSMGQGIVPQATLNSLANSIATCVNSTASSSSCSDLFSATTTSNGTPADTTQAVLNVALSPAANPSGVYLLATATPPFEPTLTSAPATYALSVAHPSDVLLYHNDAARTGVQSSETTLTPANVNSTHFGKLNTFAVDSYLFAQPLYVGGLGMPDGQVHNLLFAASSRGTVYAFDADGNNPPAGYLWSFNYIPAGQRPVNTGVNGGCPNPPEAGITGTPVIDRATQTIYFSVKSYVNSPPSTSHYLHAVSLIDGTERPGSPVYIVPDFAGTGAGSTGGVIPWQPGRQSQRAALLLTPDTGSGKTVWLAFASHCDSPPYHGDVLGFNSSSLQITSAFNNTPNGSQGGIWGSNGGPNADAAGNIYVLGGNGTFDLNTGGVDYGDSALKLRPAAASASSNLMTVTDFFTPSNQATLNTNDQDLGGAEAILIHDAASGVAPNLMIANDKNGYIYLLNTDQLGSYRAGTHGIDGLNADVQDFGGSGVIVNNFAFFNNILYSSTPTRAYTFVPGTSTSAGHFNTSFTAGLSFTSSPVVSANGTSNAIVWALDTGNTLHALAPGTLTELYNSGQAASNRDAPPMYVKFTSPVIANGKVFVSGEGSLSVYGLLP